MSFDLRTCYLENYKTYKLNFINWLQDISQLVKLKLSLMVVFSSLAAYLVFSGSTWNTFEFVCLLIGGLFITFSSNVINQVLERDYDKLMTRTRLRPLADNRMTNSSAVLIAGLLSVFGSLALACISPLCASLGMISLVLYAFVYTPLKRYSTIAIPVGAIPGALPALVAGVAAQGELSFEAMCLFGVQYFWQFPHFWAIAWLGHQDYKNAGFKLIKDIQGQPDALYGLYAFFYCILSIVLVTPLLLSGYLHGWIFILLTISMLVYGLFSFQLYLKNNRTAARNLMFASILYLPLVLVLFIFNTLN